MRVNPITLILILCFFYPLIKGFIFKFSSHDLKRGIQGVTGNIAFVISLFLGVYYAKLIFVQHEQGVYKKIYDMIPPGIKVYVEGSSAIIYFVIIPICIFIIFKIIEAIFVGINSITFFPVLDTIERSLENKGDFFKRCIGALFKLPKAICYILIITFLLNISSIFDSKGMLNSYLGTSLPYDYICREVVIPITNSKLAKQLPNIINNSLKVVVKESEDPLPSESVNGKRRVIVYYNGITLDEAVKSNAQIDSFGRELVKKDTDSKVKARTLYNWIGNNISYDHNKAEMVLNNDFSARSGAVPTFETKKGICFDYATLFVAMCRADGLKVRLITGQGFNGVSWVNHAWNQVYIPEENKWINVDTTFYKGGNYFNSRRFDFDHRASQIAGEW